MLFNSYPFVFVFLPIVLLGFFLIARASHLLAALWLALASLFFYGWWNSKYVLLLLLSVAFNYAVGYVVGRAGARTGRSFGLLAAGVAGNLLLLGYFKYTNFFLGVAGELAGTNWQVASIILPLGISFFTFTQIAFLVDVYRGISHEYRFVHYILFVTYFPHLIAGPILHHSQLIPQLSVASTYRPNIDNINAGLTIFAIGLFKKVVLADQFAAYADPVFAAADKGTSPHMVDAWIAALAYALQLYLDFSAYSDMAIGLSKMFNIELPINFHSPYKARSIIDFWRRWHMTLSAFLRDYLYIPLGGNRHGVARRHVNVMITMLLGGLWHGANWTFVLWGALHGLYLVINNVWRAACARYRLPKVPGSALLGGALTFLAVVLAWVPFRASNLATTLIVWKGMFQPLPSLTDALATRQEAAYMIVVGLLVVWCLPNTLQWVGSTHTDVSPRRGALLHWRALVGMGLLAGLMFAIAVAHFGKPSPFLYFQF